MSTPTNYLESLSWKHVKIKSGLWGDRVRLNRDVVLDYQYEQIEKTGRVDNFRRASKKKVASLKAYSSMTRILTSGLRQPPTPLDFILIKNWRRE